MGAWTLLQICVDLGLVIGISVMWVRLRRPPQDDPRLSRGLQLLQSKIAVLEDLSDRTDAQVKQLTHLIEQKARLLQNKIIESEHQIQRVDSSMQKSKEVAEIFQDKIPHQEIVDRQQTIKYVKAAQMAHAGHSIEEIAAEVDLPVGQLELIAKLNKDELVFDAEALPEWAKSEIAEPQTGNQDLDVLFTPPKEEYSSLKRLGEEFRNACVEFEQAQVMTPHPLETFAAQAKPAISSAATAIGEETSALFNGAKKVTSKLMTSANDLLHQAEQKAKSTIVARSSLSQTTRTVNDDEIKKVEFPRMETNKNLL